MAVPYAFRLAAQSIFHEKWINFLSILTIASGLLITALIALSVYNVDATTRKLPEKFSMMFYLKDNLSRQELENILNTLGKDDAVEMVKYIPKGEALKELKTMLKDVAYVFEGLEENPLHNSIEAKLKREAVGPETAKRLASEMRAIEGIDEVEYGEKFLSSIYSIKVGTRAIGTVFIIIMSGGVIFVCYSTVKILFYRKKEEIETYKLLGAKKRFIRAPFIIEGAFVGFCGGLLSLIGILSLYYLVFLRLSLSIPFFKAIIFPTNISLLLPLTGLLLGMVGAAIAIGRIRY
ncbi:MAG: permease-like cell division protein FtsX [Nitrospirota bacterium]